MSDELFRGHTRPQGWRFTHEHQDELISADGLMCEAHPGLPFMHDEQCAGPGMPWLIVGRAAVETFAERARRVTG